MRKTIVSRSPAFAAAAFAVALMTALLAGCPQPTDPESPKSDDATLKSLSLKAGETSLELDPAFDPGTITYRADVSRETASVEVTAEPSHTDAATVISSGGTAVSGTITLNAAGTITVVTITVTAADGETEKIYDITIHRDAPDPENDATLKSLVLQTGTTTWILDPVFASTTTQYTVNVTTTVSAVTIRAEPSQSDATATPVGGALNPAGETTPVYVEVTAADGETKQRYNITIHRAAPDASTNNNLGNLTVSPGTLSPSFSASTTEYTLRLPYNVEAVEISAVALDSANATLSGTGTKSLVAGPNECKIIVVSQSGVEKVYTIVITREMDPRLATLSAAPHTLDPPFDPDTTFYTVSQVTFDVAELPLTYTPMTADAAITVTGNTLYQGTNAVTLTVRTADGTEKFYTLSVPKAGNPNGSSDNTLKALSLQAPSGSHASNVPVLSPAFEPDTLSYTVNGWTNGASIIIDAEKNDEKAVLRGVGTRGLQEVGKNNALSFTVTAENGAERTYVINVYRKSNDVSVPLLRILPRGSYNINWAWSAILPRDEQPPLNQAVRNEDGSLEWHITAGITRPGPVIVSSGGLAVLVPAAGTSVTVTKRLPGEETPSAFAPINNNEYLIDPLTEGDSYIILTVMAEDGITTQVYNFCISYTRPLSTDATLKSITVTGGNLNVAFDPGVESYNVFIPTDSMVTSVTVAAEANDPGAHLEGEDAAGKKTVTLSSFAPGSPETATFKVTAENIQSEKTYTVSVYRTTGGGPDTVWTNLSDLTAYLASMPENTADTPHTVKLGAAINFAGLQSQNNRPLVNLMTALNGAGRYVSVDASAFTDTPSKANDSGSNATDGRAYLVEMILPASLTAIPDYFFANCANLGSFNWSNHTSLTIGSNAFRNTRFVSLTLPSTITSIGTSAFAYSTALKTADLSAVPVNSFNAGWFGSCGELEAVIPPTGATTWTGQLGAAHAKLNKVVIPAGMITIPDDLCHLYFRPANFIFDVAPGNTAVAAIFEGKALVKLGVNNAKTLLTYPSAAGAVVVPADITAITQNAFRGSPITSVSIPDLVTSLPEYAFYQCPELQSVAFGTGLTGIPSHAFRSCPKLESLSIPKNIKSIGQYAFQSAGTSSAAGFKVVLAADGVARIDYGAFYSSGLKSITMPASITTLDRSVFFGCTALESIDLSDLTITTLEEATFQESSLAEVKLPSTLGTIGTNAFRGCSALAGITLPGGLTSLGASAFSASGLTSITLPASLASLSGSVFSSCAKLQWVKILKEDALITLPAINSFPFPLISSAYPFIYVPDDLFTQYAGDVELEQASQWTNCPAAAVPYIKRMSQFAE